MSVKPAAADDSALASADSATAAENDSTGAVDLRRLRMVLPPLPSDAVDDDAFDACDSPCVEEAAAADGFFQNFSP